ncbi:MAG: ABC transporter ATP-binding protein [Actinobacteria bacterium]|nr:ABC transporter ATP-binding protein [Actinomycetota bacterium]
MNGVKSNGAEPLLELADLRVTNSNGGLLVDGVSLDVGVGEAVAIVGESGSGKSLTARASVGLLPRGLTAEGSIRYRGQELIGMAERSRARLRGAEVTMILQDPFTMLHPMLRCGNLITETLRDERGRRLGRAARREEAVRRLAEVGIDDPAVARRYPFELSGGMRQRVAIAAALAQDPKLLIADEPSTALDVTTQKDILDLLAELKRSRGMSLVLITHDLRVAFSVCDRINVMYAGSLVEVGPPPAVASRPAHPYTLGLLLAEPPADRRIDDLIAIPGSVPSAATVTEQCAFADRCRWATDACRDHRQRPLSLAAQMTRCERFEEIAAEMDRVRVEHQAAATEAVVATREEDALVHVHELEVTYPPRGRHGHEVQALRGVTLDIVPGESLGIVGESGSGKTTLGRCMTGLATPTGGKLEIAGIDATDLSALSKEDRRAVRRSVQMIFQDPYSTLNPARTIGAALSEALALRLDRSARSAEIDALLERVGLPAAYASRKPVALSGGERQRVAIARAIAVEPSLLICDEPVSALDVSVQAQILGLLREIREESGVAFMFITHDLAVVRQIADRVHVVYKGQIVESGPVAEILDTPKHPYTQRLVSSIPGGADAERDRVGG